MTKLTSLKIFLFTIIALLCHTAATAQKSNQILEGNALQDAIYNNVKSGLPQFTGMLDQYVLTMDNMKEASINGASLSSEIRAVQDAVNCTYDFSNSQVIIVFNKPNNKDFYANDYHLAAVKQILDNHGMRMIADKLNVIKK